MTLQSKQTMAVLMTCHNRCETTLRCLERLFISCIPTGLQLDVYLVDDGSTDGTADQVAERFPHVHAIAGDGTLYWAGGMRKAWDVAASAKSYDFYLWLNDDTLIYEDAIQHILADYECLKRSSIESLLVGAFKDPDLGELTYSARLNGVQLAPSGTPQPCDNITGNFCLVSRAVFEGIGNLSPWYTHGIADADYALRALKSGFSCHVVSYYSGECTIDGNRIWYDPKYSFGQRLRGLYDLKGGNIVEYCRFIRIHSGCFHAMGSFLKSFARVCVPRLFSDASTRQKSDPR